jgi:biotin-(acetyl-CoA carboxylase) ligase
MMRAVVLGIGLNVETVPKISGNKFTPKVGCLKDYSESVDIKTVFHALLDSLYTQYQLVKNNRIQNLHKVYIKRSLLIGKNIAVYMEDKNKPDFIGKVIGLGQDLELIFENNIPPIRSGRIEILVS